MRDATAQPKGPPDRLRTVAILPARIGSRRLPRKMLLAETGRPLFLHSAENVARCQAVDRVVIATDSEEILEAGAKAGIEMIRTLTNHPSGTDRVHEALGRLDASFDVVLNVQADEPDVEPHDLARLIGAFADADVEAATLFGAIDDPAVLESRSVVKVVRDRVGDALYFSRSPVPDRTHAREGPAPDEPCSGRHVGVYAFRPDALRDFCSLPVGQLEALESLEQLRWLEAGRRMRVIEARHVPLGIDTRADYDAFVARLATATQLGGSKTR